MNTVQGISETNTGTGLTEGSLLVAPETGVSLTTAAVGVGLAIHGAFVTGRSISNLVSQNGRVHIEQTDNSGSSNSGKQSKVEKSEKTENIGNGKFTKTTTVRPGKGPGQSRAEYVRYKNSSGKVIKTQKFSYDRANKFQHKKAMRGGPEGRAQTE